MPDRSSHQGLPEDWNHGSHAARGPFGAAGASNGYGGGKAGSHRARTADGYGAEPTAAYGAPKTDALGTRAESYGTGNGEAAGARADGYGAVRTDAYPVRPTDAYGAAADRTARQPILSGPERPTRSGPRRPPPTAR